MARAFRLGHAPRCLAEVGRWYEIPGKPSAADFAEPSRELCDLVRMATAASRAGRGDLVWAGYNITHPGKGKSTKERLSAIKFGTQLIMVNTAGAAKLLLRMPPSEEMRNKLGKEMTFCPPEQRIEMGHWDNKLLKSLMADGGKALGACYIYPPVGNYAGHPSAIDARHAGDNFRGPCWEDPWCCPGTRASDDPKKRQKWLCGPTPAGEPQWLAKLNVSDDPALDWKSFWARPGKPPSMPGTAVEPSATAAPGTAAASSSSSSAAPLLPRSTKAPPPPPGVPKVSYKLPPPPPPPVPAPPPAAPSPAAEPSAAADTGPARPKGEVAEPGTKRARREARQQQLYRARRVWVEKEEEAGRRRVPGKCGSGSEWPRAFLTAGQRPRSVHCRGECPPSRLSERGGRRAACGAARGEVPSPIPVALV